MDRELSKTYEPQEVESRVYRMWEENGCFEGHRDPDKEPFTIVMPPPNVTGQLHMARHRPRRHRHPDQGGGGAPEERGAHPL